MKGRELLLAAVAVFVVLCCAKAGSLWEFDEVLFAQAVQHFDPAAHQPPPPGYPVFIFAAKFVRVFTPSDFAALVALSVFASAAGFVLLALAFARMTDWTTGLTGSLLFYFSPAMLVHSTLALSEPGAIGLLATSLFFAPASPALFGAFAALTVGWRPQMCLFVVPLLFARFNWKSIAAFTIVCLGWLIPLAVSLGGIDNLVRFETAQAQYVSAHDAGMSRMAWKPAAVVIQFVSHPWGPRVMALPVLAAAAFGVWRLRRNRAVYPLAIAGAVYIAIALRIMDPADGVRYAIPFLVIVALAAAAGVTALAPLVGRYEAAIVFAIGSIIYVSSFIAQRASGPSPAVQAATMIPPNAVVGYEPSLWPHARYFFGARRAMRIDDSVQRLFGRPDIPLYAYLNGTTDLPNARTFRWENSDAYWNLTRNFYRVVSIAPLGPARRYRAIRGVYTQEREADAIAIAGHGDITAEVWRWTDGNAAIEMANARAVTLRIGLPKSFAYPDNRVTLVADGQAVATIDLQRGEKRTIAVRFPHPSRVLEIRADRVVQPPGDPRRLAVALYDLEFRVAGTAPPHSFTPAPTSFESALLGFNPYVRRPPPPSYPLYVGLGKAVNFFVHDARISLVALSIAGSLLTFAVLARTFRGWIGLLVAAVAAMIPFATAPDHAAIACFAVALAAANPVVAGAAAAAAVGIVPQTIAGVLLFLIVLERRLRAWMAFTVVLAVEFLQTVQNIEIGRLRAFVHVNMDGRRLFDPAAAYGIPIVLAFAVAYHFLLDGTPGHLTRRPHVQRGGEH